MEAYLFAQGNTLSCKNYCGLTKYIFFLAFFFKRPAFEKK